MNKPNDKYYTVSQVKRAKSFRRDVDQVLKDAAMDIMLGRPMSFEIFPDGRFAYIKKSKFGDRT